MCGIAGIFGYVPDAPPVDEAELVRMRDRMVKRGPDGAGLYLAPDGCVGHGHRRLAILDPHPRGVQPMWSADGRYGIVYNGEIYNFRELAADLARDGYVFRTGTDTEVLLELYRRDGPAMCAALRGMFAFGIWDTRERALFLARDPFGIKPLYLHDDGRMLRFASQVKALLAGGGIDLRPESAGLAGFWVWGHVPEPWTLYHGIQSLAPGSWLRLEQGGRRQSGQFHDLFDTMCIRGKPVDPAPAEPARASRDHLRDAVLDSVRHHLIADVPVGVFLSAGIDSATIAALAAETGARLRTLTLGFLEYRGTPADETVLAEQVARHYGAEHQTLWVGAEDFADALDRVLVDMDQPSVDGLNTWLVARAAARTGLKVALSGLGGDELFGGYPSFRHVPLMHALARPLAGLPTVGRAFRCLSLPALRRFTSVKYGGRFEYGGSWEGAYLLRRAERMPWELSTLPRSFPLAEPELLRDGLDKLRAAWLEDRDLAALGTKHRHVAYLETTRYMRDRLLRDADWAGMAHSLEIRVPLVDPTVLVAAMQPAGTSQAAQTPVLRKRDLAACARPPLPPGLLNRPKSGFGVPIRDRLMADGDQAALQRGLRGWQERVARAFDASSISAHPGQRPTGGAR